MANDNWNGGVIDLNWDRVIGKPWTCATCSEKHQGVFDLGCVKPDAWPGSEEYLPNSFVEGGTDGLSEDFCVVEGQHYFVRCILPLPLIGAPSSQQFAFGVWSTLSKKNFAVYAETFDSGKQASLGPWFGWFSNRLKGYPDTLNLKCQVNPQSGRTRPWLELEATDHPLSLESREGISFSRLVEIYSLNGHRLG